MQKKLRLQRADRYAYLVCAHMMSEMVVAYLEGRQAAKWLGCEQGAVPDWDDIVQELSDGSLRHTQVKRQVTDFSNETALRQLKSPKPHKTKGTTSSSATPSLPDLSAFDDSIAALGKWFSSPAAPDGKVRTFIIQVPDRQVKIKREFDIRNFEEFCALCNLNTTTPSGLAAHATGNKAAAHIFDWLTTWCDFTDWIHIHKAFRQLKVKVRSLEDELEQQSEFILERHFYPASEALKVLLHDLEYNSTDAGAATPRQILTLIGQYLRPEVPIWTQYAMEETTYAWGISGFATGHAADIESPVHTVPIYWKGDIPTAKRLKICVKFNHHILSSDPLARRLIRLALHLSGPGQASFAEVKPWSVAVSGVLANTLGVTSNDFSNLQWIEAKDISYCFDSRQLPGVIDVNLESSNLDLAMGKVVWDLIKANVSGAIRSMQSGNLQSGVDALWQKLYPALDSDLMKAQVLLGEMLSPASEGLGALGVMRVGPRTVQLLGQGLMMMLITAVALRRDADVAALIGGKDIRVVALRYWGGPASMSKTPRVLVDEEGDTEVEDFLGKEVADIVLMSQVQSPHSEVNRLTIAADRSAQDSFGMSRRAKLAVTNSRQFREAVRTGTIEKVANLLEPELRLRGLAREENIAKIELTK